jgi:hypothetical protein
MFALVLFALASGILALDESRRLKFVAAGLALLALAECLGRAVALGLLHN